MIPCILTSLPNNISLIGERVKIKILNKEDALDLIQTFNFNEPVASVFDLGIAGIPLLLWIIDFVWGMIVFIVPTLKQLPSIQEMSLKKEGTFLQFETSTVRSGLHPRERQSESANT